MYSKIKKLLKKFKAWRFINRIKVGHNDVILDFGANIGDVSFYFLNKGCIVHAWEPHPTAYKILCRRLNKYEKFHPYNVAVSNCNGSSKLYLHSSDDLMSENGTQGATLDNRKNNISSKHVEVQVISIAEIFSKFDRVRLIKIDIEGGEYKILPYLINNPDKFDFVVCETHAEKHHAFCNEDMEIRKLVSSRGLQGKIFLDWH